MPNLPIVEPLRLTLSAESVFRRLPPGRGLFFLDSALPAGELGRWSILGFDPYRIVERPAGKPTHADPLSDLEEALTSLRPSSSGNIPGPFQGGAVGFISYDLGRRFERIPSLTRDDLCVPDLWFGLYDLFAVFDHRLGLGWIVSTGEPEQDSAAERRAETRLYQLRHILSRDDPGAQPCNCGPLLSTHTEEDYCEAVEHCLDWIAAGDIYQVNLSQRFGADFAGSPGSLYVRLRHSNPAPFAAYIDTGMHQVLSSSPERFVRVTGNRVETRPIKGTRPRSGDTETDRRLSEELLASEKDHAELTMIVDLLRNDLGRVCRYGTVRTESLAHLESYETVHHLVGVVTGRLRPDVGVCDLIRAAFPGGSITGAPKIRAMEIIEALEAYRRGIFYGSIGYIGTDGCLDLNIAIRTVLVRDGGIHLQVGGGIVADSVPKAEYEETLHKAEGIFRAMEVGPGSVEAAKVSLADRVDR